MRERDYGFSGQYGMSKISTEHWWGIKLFPKELYQFTNNPDDPLTYRSFNGVLYRIGASFPTDKGSVPPVARLFIRPTAYERAYAFHDYGYRYGGLFQSRGGCGAGYVFVPMSRLEVDLLLRETILNSGGSWAAAEAVYRGVRVGAGGPWKRYRANDLIREGGEK